MRPINKKGKFLIVAATALLIYLLLQLGTSRPAQYGSQILDPRDTKGEQCPQTTADTTPYYKSLKDGICRPGCPSGSYEIGRSDNGYAICKNQPTGCPYGDSIPLDSPKCAPNTAEEVEAAKQAATPPQEQPVITYPNFQGK